MDVKGFRRIMKIAIISDIHANLPALEKVLEDIHSNFKADQVYCLGDLTDGAPWANEVINLIREYNIPTIMGNHDERIAFDYKVHPLKKHTLEEQLARAETIRQTKDKISEVNLKYLSELKSNIKFSYAGISFLLVHGSPKSNEEYIYENHDTESIIGMFESNQADVIVSGHTHLSFIKEVYSTDLPKLFINAGSVGRSKELNGGKAVYLQLTINEDGPTFDDKVKLTLRKIDYDIHKTINDIKNSSTPDFYADFLLKSIL
ncbi:metallophosphoesterase family protein [Dysgonomonas capnocytophagoides]|uniref:metallophosphoesterase family protein n=1 Tax=Dysgonomonas capnocytophagoides TaxID=45254 RepID=UPI0030C83947